jgi:hypothetical protein
MKKVLFSVVYLIFVTTSLFGQSIPVAMASVNYSSSTITFDKTKVLNVARGGQGISGDLTWMPKFYDKLVEIGVNEFRVDWLLSNRFYNVVSRNGSGTLVYTFTNLDKTILPMAQKGMKPLMCMTYMAGVLGKDSFPPNDYAEYKATIKAYVQHYKDLGYTGWAWESHNEPEGFTKLTPAQVYTMYETFSAAVKEVDPTARVGGYGAVGKDWISFLRSFLDIYKADTSKPVMDFYSFHQYGKESWEDVPVIESAFTDRGLTVPNLYITEWNNHWGSAPGQGNAGLVGGSFDTNVNATYIAKKMYNSYLYPNVKKIYYFNFADTDPTKKFSGDLGIFTVDAMHYKSGANVFKMYNSLYGSMLGASISGTGTSTKNVYGLFTVDKTTQKIAAIIWNYQNSSVSFKTVLSNLPTLPVGWEYRVDKLLIDSTHANFYNDFKSIPWISIRASPNEKAAVVESFRVSGNLISHTDTLQKYSVVQFFIEPQLSNTAVDIVKSERVKLIVAKPNVFNTSTEISYSNNGNKDVSLLLYGLGGNLIKVLSSGNNSTGSHTVTLQGNGLSSGMYFLALKSGKSLIDSTIIVKQ